jgi:predicted 3-demethylubiquinone-9 3-methyltransferase (glyoxalase superfamily)
MAKNTICVWYDKDAEETARFYAKTFPTAPCTPCTARPLITPWEKKVTC